MSIMHDANHGAYSRSTLFGRVMGATLDVAGASRCVGCHATRASANCSHTPAARTASCGGSSTWWGTTRSPTWTGWTPTSVSAAVTCAASPPRSRGTPGTRRSTRTWARCTACWRSRASTWTTLPRCTVATSAPCVCPRRHPLRQQSSGAARRCTARTCWPRRWRGRTTAARACWRCGHLRTPSLGGCWPACSRWRTWLTRSPTPRATPPPAVCRSAGQRGRWPPPRISATAPPFGRTSAAASITRCVPGLGRLVLRLVSSLC